MIINSQDIRKLIYFHIFFLLFSQLLITQFAIPRVVMYVLDICVLVEVFFASKKISKTFINNNGKLILLYFFVFASYLIISAIIHFVPPVDFLLGFRKIARMYLFYIACACLLSIDDVSYIFTIILKVYLVNFALTLFQYFIQGLRGDYLGGIFGIEKGANGYTNIFICVVCTFVILEYLYKKRNIRSVLFYVVVALVITALTEIKIFFVELPIIIIMSLFITHKIKKGLVVIAGGIMLIILGINLLEVIFPGQMMILLEREAFLSYTSSAISGYNISRLNAFSDINRIFFQDNIFMNLFGYGVGACDTGTSFYLHYGHFNYSWFSHQITFMETGLVGTFFYLLFFVLTYFNATKIKKLRPEYSVFLSVTQVMIAISFVLFIYNQSLRIESGYLLFLVFAFPIILNKKDQVSTRKLKFKWRLR